MGDAMPTPRPLLVVGHAGAANQELLRRDDLRLGLALTPQEIAAHLRLDPPSVCLVRAGLVAETLGARGSATTPIVALLGPGDAPPAGATVAVPADRRAAILEAISALTGLRFAEAPRVPTVRVVEVAIDGDPEGARLFETVDLSASGVSIRGVEPRWLGRHGTIRFPLDDDPFDLRVLAVRAFRDEDGVDCVGFAFLPGAAVRARLESMVAETLAAMDRIDTIPSPPPDPLPVLPPDLAAAVVRGLGEPEGDTLPAWARRAAARLTPVERRALAGAPLPAWVAAAAQLRLALARAGVLTVGPLPAPLVGRALGAARALAAHARGSSPEVLLDVTRIRADLSALVLRDPVEHRPAERSA